MCHLTRHNSRYLMTVTVSRTMSARAQSEERKANIFLINSITMLAHNTKQSTIICIEALMSEDSDLGISWASSMTPAPDSAWCSLHCLQWAIMAVSHDMTPVIDNGLQNKEVADESRERRNYISKTVLFKININILKFKRCRYHKLNNFLTTTIKFSNFNI